MLRIEGVLMAAESLASRLPLTLRHESFRMMILATNSFGSRAIYMSALIFFVSL